MPPTTIRWWHLTAADQSSAVHVNAPLCGWCRPGGRPCNTAPAWVAAWTVNETGLPSFGTECTAYLCGGCLHDRLDLVKDSPYIGPIALTPYKEVTS